MTDHVLSNDARRTWKRFVGVRFISPTEEDATLAALESFAQELLAEKAKSFVAPATLRAKV